MDPLFRQRLRNHYRDLQAQLLKMERGTPAWFDCEKAMASTQRLYGTLYGEAIQPVHEAGPRVNQPLNAKDPPPG